jgi:glucose/arabinose dehydrogenase
VTARRAIALALTAATCLVLGACGFGPPPPDQNGSPPTFPSPSGSASTPGSEDNGADATIDVLASKLPQPWGVALLPDGSGLVTERKNGHIVKVGQPPTADGLTVSTYAVVPGVNIAGDGGLLGIAVSPHYATDKTVFVYYSTTVDNRVAAVRPGVAPHVILTGIPHGPLDNGGGLAFGPDGYLYVGTGDAGHVTGGAGAVSQSRTSLGGKILRVTTAGKPAPGNPVKASPIYASGFRDIEGLAWDSHKHLLVIDSSRTSSTLDLVTAGGNFGWPLAGTAQVPANAKFAQPLQTWPLAESTCAGVATIDTVVATACLTGKRLWLVQLTANAVVFGAPGATLNGKFGRLRGIATAADGSLWITTSNTDGHGTPAPADDQLIRVVLADEGAGRS